MDWEFWSKELDEEVLVENGEFGSEEVVCRRSLSVSPAVRCNLYSDLTRPHMGALNAAKT